MDELYKENKTDLDFEVLIQENKGLVYSILKRFNYMRDQDMESAAMMALYNAIGTFDIYSTYAFSTYATQCIRRSLYAEHNKRNAAKRNTYTQVSIDSMSDEAQVNEDMIVDSAEDINASNTNMQVLCDMFDRYLSSMSPRSSAYSVLVTWKSSGFTYNTNRLSAICNASSSYISRVLTACRLYLKCHMENYPNR